MPNLWFPLAGLLAGLVAGWLIGQLRAQAQRMKLDNRAVTAESALAELRGQVQQRETDLKIVQETLSEQQAGRVTAETRLAEAQLYIEEQKKFLAGAEQRFSDTFNALAGESLKSNNQAFLDLAKKTLENLITEARGDLSKRQEGVEAVVKPLQETLKKYEVQLRELESHRAEAYGNLNKHLEELKKAHDGLQKETGQLVSALKRPQVRGRWGEITLRRVVEVAGLSRYCDFEEQVSLEGEEGKQRPDLIVRLPGNRTVVVDAKVPLAAYMDAMETADEEKRQAAFTRHAEAVRLHARQLGSKNYWNQFNPSPDFVVLFLPGESFFSAALEQDRKLIESSMENRVLLATPTTLISLLRTVATTWQQYEVTANAKTILDAGQELFDRLAKFSEYLSRVGEHLDRAARAYNEAVGSWASRLMPGVRHLKELGAGGTGRETVELEPVDTSLRELPGAPVGEKKLKDKTEEGGA